MSSQCISSLISVTLGFFDDILIPVNALQHPSRFDETDQAWVWEYPVEDGDKHDLFMDSGTYLGTDCKTMVSPQCGKNL